MLSVFMVQLICNLKTGPVLVLHTEAKVLLLSQNETVRPDWSAMLITSARPSLTFLEGERGFIVATVSLCTKMAAVFYFLEIDVI